MVQTAVRNELSVTLADILVSQGIMTKDQVKQCEAEHRKSDAPIGQIILKMGFATNESIAGALESHYNVPYVDIENYVIDPVVIKLVPERLARKFKFLPLFKIINNMSIAIADPRNLFGIDEIRDKLGSDIEVMVSTEEQILQSLDKYYGSTTPMEDMTDIVDEIVQSEFGNLDEEVEVEKVKEVSIDAVSEEALEKSPVVKLLNTILLRAIREGVSDIHIQQEEDTMLVRYRLDGALYQASALPKALRTTLVSRIKILSV